MDMESYSLNDYVLVRLNEHGRDILTKYSTAFSANFPTEFWEQADGWYKFQMWEFMYIFGQYTYIGVPPITETTEFKIQRSL